MPSVARRFDVEFRAILDECDRWFLTDLLLRDAILGLE